MKIPGTTKVQLLLLTILMISSVSSTGLLIYNQVNNTLEENTSTKNVSLEVVRDGLRLRVTGNDTMEALTNLVQIESYLETLRFPPLGFLRCVKYFLPIYCLPVVRLVMR